MNRLSMNGTNWNTMNLECIAKSLSDNQKIGVGCAAGVIGVCGATAAYRRLWNEGDFDTQNTTDSTSQNRARVESGKHLSNYLNLREIARNYGNILSYGILYSFPVTILSIIKHETKKVLFKWKHQFKTKPIKSIVSTISICTFVVTILGMKLNNNFSQFMIKKFINIINNKLFDSDNLYDIINDNKDVLCQFIVTHWLDNGALRIVKVVRLLFSIYITFVNESFIFSKYMNVVSVSNGNANYLYLLFVIAFLLFHPFMKFKHKMMTWLILHVYFCLNTFESWTIEMSGQIPGYNIIKHKRSCVKCLSFVPNKFKHKINHDSDSKYHNCSPFCGQDNKFMSKSQFNQLMNNNGYNNDGQYSQPIKKYKLNMTHVYLSYTDYLWSWYHLASAAMQLWSMRLSELALRKYFLQQIKENNNNNNNYYYYRLINRFLKLDKSIITDSKYRQIVGKFCLESMQAIHFKSLKKKTDNNQIIAIFEWKNVKYINPDTCKFEILGFMTIEVDVITKQMVNATLYEKMQNDNNNNNNNTIATELTGAEALTLTWFGKILTDHVKIHAFSNFGVSTQNSDAHIRQNSVATVSYNMFGNLLFPQLMVRFYNWGITDYNFEQVTIDAITQAMTEDIPIHSMINLTKIAKYSDLIHFILTVRPYFEAEYGKYIKQFNEIENCNMEALFVGSILHSLDHISMEFIEDALWLDVNSKKYGVTAEMGRLMRAGFVEDLPIPYGFTGKFKQSKHPFFQSIYQFAKKINPIFADQMDTCIIK